MGVDSMTRIRNVTAVLGPTNTGKTHLAIERMLGHETGMMGLPLRLLAREVYDRIVLRVGAEHVALITGEEKIKPDQPKYWICTVEAMPQDIEVDFLAIDEIQLCADSERGHVFTDRLLNARGELETLVLGAATMRDAIDALIPGSNFISRPRLSNLTYSGQKKITRLPSRTAIVAFSAAEVYAIAELIRQQRGGAAVVLGALSPRTRNAQVALYQSGNVDFLVATDAIGMGLNLDVDHVAFSATRKFDGQKHRNLLPAEIAQIAGRAGRHMNDGTFGVTGEAEPFDPELIKRLEDHAFDPVKQLQWRERALDFSSIDALCESLRQMPKHPRLNRTRSSEDFVALETVARDREISDLATSPKAVERLWDACQIPDYRKISSQNHAELVAHVYKFLMGVGGGVGGGDGGLIDEDWFAKQVAFSDRTDGDIDTLSNRLAHIRTWTFVANRADWLRDPGHWQQRTRQIEDSLSDALHACLAERFVDERASALMKGMKDNALMDAEISDDGSIHAENHYLGKLKGFCYLPDTSAEGLDGKTTRNAARQVIAKEMSMRVRRLVAAKDDAFSLTRNGRIVWRQDEIARLEVGEDAFRPQILLIADDSLQGSDRERVSERLQKWLKDAISERLKPLVEISTAEDLDGLARGVAFRLNESFGVLKREDVGEQIKALDQPARAKLRRFGVRFGAFNIFFPQLLKPAAADLLLTLWCLKHAKENGLETDAPPEPPRAGLTSAVFDPEIPEAFYRACGFHVCGPRAVRIDMLERLADSIRPLLSWRRSNESQTPPKGSTGDGGFVVLPEMMSILGCSPGELGEVLKSLGFRSVEVPASQFAHLKGDVRPKGHPAGATKDQNLSTTDTPGGVDGGETVATDGVGDSSGDVAGGRHVDGDARVETPADVAPAADTPQAVGSETARGEPADGKLASDGSPATAEEADRADSSRNAPQSEASQESSSPTDDHAARTEVQAGETGSAADDGGVVPAEASQDEASVDAGAEEQMLEVWRPKRRNENRSRGDTRHRSRGRANQPADGRGAGVSASGEGTGAGSASGKASREGASEAKPDNHKRRSPNRFGGKGGEQKGDRNRSRSGKSGGRNNRRASPSVHTSAPSRSKGADPDSPFAALSALKDELDKQSR